MTTSTAEIASPPTFPARPINGGNFLLSGPKLGTWQNEPKYNGWRSLVHIASGQMWNRHGARLSIGHEFTRALDALRVTLDAQAFEWADCEALERRHGIGRGCLIVLDVVPLPGFDVATYAERRGWLDAALPELALTPPADFPLLSIPPAIVAAEYTWRDLQTINRRLNPGGKPENDFYEGFVMKKKTAPYPIQLRSANAPCAGWVKHRWS
jgi:ATP-dependent DNA ligase